MISEQIAKWDYQKRLKNKPVQCANCQMFGHGERGCSIRTICSNCDSKHKTIDCSAAERIRRANFNGNHTSSDVSCPNRSQYLEMRSMLRTKQQPERRSQNRFTYTSSHFPLISERRNIQNTTAPTADCFGNYANAGKQSNSNLFTQEEFTQPTCEHISKLKGCSSKEEQFNVITHLAGKYLYSNCK